MDLSKIFNLVYRYVWLLALAALIAGLVTFLQLSSQPVAYRATTDLLVGPSLDSPSPDLNALKIGGQLTQTYAEVVSTSSFLESVNQKLAQKSDLNTLKSAISTRQSIDTRILTITVFYPDPKQAVAIANAAAQTLLETSPAQDNTAALLRTQMNDQSHQLEQMVSQSQSSIQALEAELTALKDSKPIAAEAAQANLEQQNIVIRQLTEERSRLSDALRTLATVYQILLDTDTNQVAILEPATTAILVDQQLWLRVFSAAVGGLIFAILMIFIVEYFDDRLRFPRDLSRAAGVPLLSAIDKHPRLNGSGLEQLVTFAQPESDAANRYREAVAKLIFSIGEAMPYTLLLSSVGSKAGDDAATTAGNLAVAFAQAGYRVVLVDAQLDNPALTTIFNAEKSEGLAELVPTKWTELQLLPVEQVPGIRFFPVGLALEKSSHAMLNATKVSTLFAGLQREADIVLVAGPAISRSAESLTLASRVNAVVLVARLTEASGKVVNKVVENLRQMKINLAGVIFDYNLWPLVSDADRRTVAVLVPDTSKEALQNSNLSEQTTQS